MDLRQRPGNPGVQLADLDGDRLPNLVRILPTEGRVLVAAGEGRGSFADPVDLAGVPAMAEGQRWELADVTGDGAADLVRIGDTLEVHACQHDGSFAPAAAIAWPEIELPSEPLSLHELNARHLAWLAERYHRRVHTTTGQAPLSHWLSELDHLRPGPGPGALDEVFLHRVERKVRRDGTVRWQGGHCEVPYELVGQTAENGSIVNPPRVSQSSHRALAQTPLRPRPEITRIARPDTGGSSSRGVVPRSARDLFPALP